MTADTTIVSFCIPCYNSFQIIPKLVDDIRNAIAVMDGYDYEIILVCDASPDDFAVIRLLSEADSGIKGVDLACHVGYHASLMAGYKLASGDIVISLDYSLHSSAFQVERLVEAIENGSDVVFARYDHPDASDKKPHHRSLRKRINSYVLGKPKELITSNYFGARKFVIDELLCSRNSYPFVIGQLFQITSNISSVYIETDHIETDGETTGIVLWLNDLVSVSVKPLRFAALTGVACVLLGIVYIIYTIVRKILNSGAPMGFPTLICFTLVFGGFLMLMLGLVGEYVGRTYLSVIRIPQYSIREIVNHKDSLRE